jgi:hypothetical protein
LTDRQDELLEQLALLTKEGFPKAKEEWEKGVAAWGKSYLLGAALYPSRIDVLHIQRNGKRKLKRSQTQVVLFQRQMLAMQYITKMAGMPAEQMGRVPLGLESPTHPKMPILLRKSTG